MVLFSEIQTNRGFELLWKAIIVCCRCLSYVIITYYSSKCLRFHSRKFEISLFFQQFDRVRIDLDRWDCSTLFIMYTEVILILKNVTILNSFSCLCASNDFKIYLAEFAEESLRCFPPPPPKPLQSIPVVTVLQEGQFTYRKVEKW
jgi:hypothetical protein